MHIDHVAINVSNLEAIRDFFVKYFGGKANEGYHNPHTGLRSYFLEFPESNTRLEIMNWPDLQEQTPEKHVLGYTHICMSVGSKEAVDTMTRQLISDGFRHVSGPRTTGEGYYESCILLPGGEELELTV